MTDARQYAPATARNRDPILQVLRSYLEAESFVLEIASGTGEHGLYFSERLPFITWQPTDTSAEAIASIQAWKAASGNERLLSPRQINVQTAQWWTAIPQWVPSERPLKTLVAINMIHIAPWSATEGLFQGAQALLPPGGLVFLYGPYKRQGKHTADSNAQFDASLQMRNPEWGVRDLEAVTALGQQYGLFAEAIVQMPANNLSVILKSGASLDS